MDKKFRVQVVGFYQGELRTILWVKQDKSAIRAGLTASEADLHVTLREGEGTHDRARGDTGMAVAEMYVPQEDTLHPGRTELLANYLFADIHDDFTRCSKYRSGESASQVFLDLNSLPPQGFIVVGVYIGTQRNFFISQIKSSGPQPVSPERELIHLDMSGEPLVAVHVEIFSERGSA